MRRRDLILLGGFGVALVGAALLGKTSAPSGALRDPRPSTLLSGPRGASALAAALEKLGARVEWWRRPLFGLSESIRPDADVALVILEPAASLSDGEEAEVWNWVRAGGCLIVAGRSAVEHGFGVAVVYETERESEGHEGLAVSLPAGIETLPPLRAVLARAGPAPGAPAHLPVERVDTLLLASNRRPVAERITVTGGGEVLVLADVSWLDNASLKRTDVGALVIPWLLQTGARRFVVDEYHQGFGRRGAIFVAAWDWLQRSPAGWMMLQLAVVGLVTLVVAAVRFGPALHRIERRRRSPLEHLDALAAGLERAGGAQTATDLLARGLRRRLRRGGLDPMARGRDQWLVALANASGNPETQTAVKRLRWLVRESSGGEEHVLRTAQAVEDVWEALRRPSEHARS
jgi:hypothetical protein